MEPDTDGVRAKHPRTAVTTAPERGRATCETRRPAKVPGARTSWLVIPSDARLTVNGTRGRPGVICRSLADMERAAEHEFVTTQSRNLVEKYALERTMTPRKNGAVSTVQKMERGLNGPAGPAVARNASVPTESWELDIELLHAVLLLTVELTALVLTAPTSRTSQTVLAAKSEKLRPVTTSVAW